MNNCDQETARRIIKHLKAGTTPIDAVHLLNVGNDPWYAASKEAFSEIEADGDSLVRFVKGHPGDGKSHFLGMQRSLALARGWAVSFVTAEKTKLNKFDIVYSEVVKNLTMPPKVSALPWLTGATTKGPSGLLAALFTRWYTEMHPPSDKKGIGRMEVIQAIYKRTDSTLASMAVCELVAKAVRAYMRAALASNATLMNQIVGWFEGGDGVPDCGLTRRIDQRLARDVMRAISLILRAAGGKGVLVLLDEAERIMSQARSVRLKSYGVIRDLLDNADGQGGMSGSITYVAATPDMFTSLKGFPEYDPLRSRLASSQRFSIPGLPDWRGVTVDLTTEPLSHDTLVEMAAKVRQIHAIARDWSPEASVSDKHLVAIVDMVDKGVFRFTKPRMVVSSVASLLEIAQQHRGADITAALQHAIDATVTSLAKQPTTPAWE